MHGTGRNAGLGLDEIDDVESKAPSKIRPRIMVGDELDAGIRCQRLEPSLTTRLEFGKEAPAIGHHAFALRRHRADENLGGGCGNEGGVVGIEPIVRVRHAVRMSAFVDYALPADFEKWNACRGVQIGVATAHEALVADPAGQRIQPVIVAEPDPHQHVRAPKLVDISRARLERFRVRSGRHDRFHRHQVATDCGHQRGEVRRRGDHAHRRGGRGDGYCTRDHRRDEQAGKHLPHLSERPRCSSGPGNAPPSVGRWAPPACNPSPCSPDRRRRGG